MYYYAEYCRYGLRSGFGGDQVMRFETRAERDEMVERLNDAKSNIIEGVCAPITRKEAAKSYRIQDFARAAEFYGTGYDRFGGIDGPRTCEGRIVLAVYRKARD